MYFSFFKPQDWRKRSVVRGRGFIQRFPKSISAQAKPRGKSKEGGRSPLLGRFKGIAKGQGSHANPAKRFVWEKEEQRNGRGLSAASGGQDEGCGVCSDATPP